MGKWAVMLHGGPASACSCLFASLSTPGPQILCPLVPCAFQLCSSTPLPRPRGCHVGGWRRPHTGGRQVAGQREHCHQGLGQNPATALGAWASLSASCSSHPQHGHLPSHLAAGGRGVVRITGAGLVKGVEQCLAYSKRSVRGSCYLYHDPPPLQWMCESTGKFWASSCPDR